VRKGDVDLTADVYSQLWAINEFKNAEPLKSTPLKDTILF
jgi:hypothetical protein